MTTEIALTSSEMPKWLELCKGDWMGIKDLEADKLPSLTEIEQFTESLSKLPNCTENEAMIFGLELTGDEGLQTARDDKRAESPRFGRIMTKMFMEFPFIVVDQAIDNLITDLKWLPEPARIREELDRVNHPRVIALARAGTLRMRVKQLGPKLSVVPLNAEKRAQLDAMRAENFGARKG